MAAATITELSTSDLPGAVQSGAGNRRVLVHLVCPKGSAGSTVNMATYVPGAADIEGILYETDNGVVEGTASTWSTTTLTISTGATALAAGIGGVLSTVAGAAYAIERSTTFAKEETIEDAFEEGNIIDGMFVGSTAAGKYLQMRAASKATTPSKFMEEYPILKKDPEIAKIFSRTSESYGFNMNYYRKGLNDLTFERPAGLKTTVSRTVFRRFFP